MAKANGKKAKAVKTPQGITHITVGGYKSIAREQTIEIRPLTVLAGANSSGKSSMMQPLLLLKQTLEAPYDPGALLLNGPNVKFTTIDQLMPRIGNDDNRAKLVMGLAAGESAEFRLAFNRDSRKQLSIQLQTVKNSAGRIILGPAFSTDEILDQSSYNESLKMWAEQFGFSVVRDRCFLHVWTEVDSDGEHGFRISVPAAEFVPAIQSTIHVPGLRGNPERAYPIGAVGAFFPGRFESYVASIIASWTLERMEEKLSELGKDLQYVGLTWKIEAKSLNDIQVELKVGRLPKQSRGGARDLVSIADVGFGVSQTLPVVVALLVAEPGQLVYLEQPEIHLHPRAQVAMAQLLANAANRGVKVVVETHSSLLLLAIQSLVAEGKLPPSEVILHWFQRDDEGATDIRTAELDAAGRFGDWPEDFHDVSLNAQMQYLNAVERRQVAP